MNTERDGIDGEVTAVDRIASAIADGTAIDWDSEAADDAARHGVLDNLRALESIADFHTPRRPESAETEVLTPSDCSGSGGEHPSSWGEFEVHEKLGSGACADVYRARDLTLQIDIALKLPRDCAAGEDPRFSDRFLNEIRRLAQIRHPNVVEVRGAECRDGRLGMWMELLEGQDLEKLLSEQGPLSEREAALIGIDLCRAMAAIHAEGLVHRDIKAANVMRVEGGRIVLMDFSSTVERPRRDRVAEDATTLGTPFYMAPEILAGRDATAASDIYSLGVLLYRLVSGRYPVEAQTWDELREKLDYSEQVSLIDARPELPVAFTEVIDRSLSTDPEARWPTAGEMSRALNDFLSPVPPPPRPAPRWKWMAAAGAIALALAAVVWTGQSSALDVDVSLFRYGEPVSQRLHDDAQLALGDRLYLEIDASQSVYLYVLNEDALGNQFVLFPLDGLHLQNPLAGDAMHWIPGKAARATSAETNLYWEVTSEGGSETVVVVAALEPVPRLERLLGEVQTAGSSGSAIPPAAFRGLKELTTGPVPQRGRLAALTQELEREDDRGIEVWRIQLDNPSSRN